MDEGKQLDRQGDMKRLILASTMLVALPAALLLNGRATQAQRQFEAIKTENRENNAQIKACAAAVYSLPKYAPLRQHIPLTITDVTLQQLSDTSLASQDEIDAILVAHPQLQQCRKAFLTNLAQTEPSVVPIITTTYNKNEDDLVALIQRKISWGEYTHRIRDRATETQVVVKEEERRIVGELQPKKISLN